MGGRRRRRQGRDRHARPAAGGYAVPPGALRGHAEDMARVLSLDEQAEVPAGHFTDVLLTREWNPLEPKVLEYKLYAKGIGPVLAIGVSGSRDVEELLPQ